MEIKCPICQGKGEREASSHIPTMSIACEVCYGGGLVVIEPSRNVAEGSLIDRRSRQGFNQTANHRPY